MMSTGLEWSQIKPSRRIKEPQLDTTLFLFYSRTLSRSATIGFRWCHCNETPFSESWLMYRTCQTTLFYQDKRLGALYQTNAAARPFQGLSLFLKSIPSSQTEALTERPPDRQGTASL